MPMRFSLIIDAHVGSGGFKPEAEVVEPCDKQDRDGETGAGSLRSFLRGSEDFANQDRGN